MNEADRVAICKTIAVSCMWGYGGIGSVIIDALDERLPANPTWNDLYRSHQKAARREHVGVVTDASELQRALGQGYWLTNWDDDGCSLFNPLPMGGLHKYVSKALADRWRRS